MLISTALFQRALTFFKTAAGSEIENPPLHMFFSSEKLYLKTENTHISATARLPATGKIGDISTFLNPVYYFARSIKAQVIELKENEGNNCLAITSPATGECLRIATLKIQVPSSFLYRADTQTVRTSKLLHALNRVSLPLEEEDIVVLLGKRILGYGNAVITQGEIPVSLPEGIIPYACARRIVKVLKLLPKKITFHPGMENTIKFTASTDTLEAEITVIMQSIPSQPPLIQEIPVSFSVKTELLYERLRHLFMVTRKQSVMLKFDGLNLNVTASANTAISSFTITAEPQSFSPAVITVRLKPLLSFLSALKTTRYVEFCTSQKMWLVKNKLAEITLFAV